MMGETYHEAYVIATTMEFTFKLRNHGFPILMIFLDSFQFLTTSVEKEKKP